MIGECQLSDYLINLKKKNIFIEIEGEGHDPLCIMEEVENPDRIIGPYTLGFEIEKQGMRFFREAKDGSRIYIGAEDIYRKPKKINVENKVKHLRLVK